jgi:hypothetical protein
VSVSGVLVATVLVPNSSAVTPIFGTVNVNTRDTLAPGARLPTTKLMTWPFDRVTVPTELVAVAPAVALFVNVTVPLAAVPTWAFAGNAIDVITSANSEITFTEAVLLLKLLSGTLALDTTAVTVAPDVVMGTVTT